jgi:hypothetical protein
MWDMSVFACTSIIIHHSGCIWLRNFAYMDLYVHRPPRRQKNGWEAIGTRCEKAVMRVHVHNTIP